MTKKWYSSKTLWVAAISFVGAILQVTGVIEAPISADIQVTILAVLTFILRLITKEPVVIEKK